MVKQIGNCHVMRNKKNQSLKMERYNYYLF